MKIGNRAALISLGVSLAMSASVIALTPNAAAVVTPCGSQCTPGGGTATTTDPSSSSTSTSGQPTSASDPSSATSSISSPSDQAAAECWTASRMASATPADFTNKASTTAPAPQSAMSPSISVSGTEPVAPTVASTNSQSLDSSAPQVPAATGKAFYVCQDKNYVCSGAAINSDSKNVVETAAHCLHEGNGGDWHQYITSAPAYYNGLSSYGEYFYKTAIVPQYWIDYSSATYDVGFMSVFPRNGVDLVNAVGGNGMAVNQGLFVSKVRIWGWPAEPPYDGEVPYYWDGDAEADTIGGYPTNLIKMVGNPLNGGSSGGPWLRYNNSNTGLGYVFAVTTAYDTYPVQLIGTPNRDIASKMRIEAT